MARVCKDCPEKKEQIKNPEVRKENSLKTFFFPNLGKKIQAHSYTEALEILHSLDKE